MARGWSKEYYKDFFIHKVEWRRPSQIWSHHRPFCIRNAKAEISQVEGKSIKKDGKEDQPQRYHKEGLKDQLRLYRGNYQDKTKPKRKFRCQLSRRSGKSSFSQKRKVTKDKCQPDKLGYKQPQGSRQEGPIKESFGHIIQQHNLINLPAVNPRRSEVYSRKNRSLKEKERGLNKRAQKDNKYKKVYQKRFWKAEIFGR